MTPASPPQRQRRDLRTAAALGLAFILVVAAVTGIALARERRLIVQQARQDTSTLCALFDENTARTFDGVANALESVAIYVSSVRPPKNDAATRDAMRSRLPFIPPVRALFVIGPDGFIVHDTDYPATPNVTLADRPYFRQYVDDKTLGHAISTALQSRSGTGWFVAATRRITAPDGSFLGVAVAAVQLDSISKLYRKLGLDSDQQVALLQADGTLLARSPADDAMVGHAYELFPSFSGRLASQRSGTFIASGPGEGSKRIVSYRALENEPLVVVVSTDMDSVLAPWKRAAAGALAGLFALALLTVGAARFFVERQRERERAQMHRTAEQAALAVDQRRGEFLATLSHELRNVLTPVQNCIQILKIAEPGSTQWSRAREVLGEQVGQMRRLIDDLLDVSRIDTGKVHLLLEGLDLRTVLRRAADAAHPAMERASHTLDMSLPDEELLLRGDAARLQQVFTNLLGNAAKYTPLGGHIALRARREGPEAVVEVTDNGLGIPAESQARIFDMFEQVGSHADRRQGGLGIGLGLVSKLVGLHGGRVGVASDGAGRGSTFTVTLPLSQGGVMQTFDIR